MILIFCEKLIFPKLQTFSQRNSFITQWSREAKAAANDGTMTSCELSSSNFLIIGVLRK